MKKLLIVAFSLSLALACLSACHGVGQGTAVNETPVDPSTLISNGVGAASSGNAACVDANQNSICDDQEKPEPDAACAADTDGDKICDDVDDDIDGDGIANALDDWPEIVSGRIFDRLAFTIIENSLPVELAVAFTYDAVGRLSYIRYIHPSNITGEDQVSDGFDWPNSAPFDPGSDIWKMKGYHIVWIGGVPHATELNVEVKVQRQQDRIANAQVHVTNSDTPVVKDFTIAYEQALENGKLIKKAVISGPITVDAGTPQEVTAHARHSCKASAEDKSCSLFILNPYVVPATELRMITSGFDQFQLTSGLLTSARFSYQILENAIERIDTSFAIVRDAATHVTTIDSKATADPTLLTTSQKWRSSQDLKLAEATQLLVDTMHAIGFDYQFFPTQFMLP